MGPKTRSIKSNQTEKELSKAFNAAAPDEKHMAAKQTKDCAVVISITMISQTSPTAISAAIEKQGMEMRKFIQDSITTHSLENSFTLVQKDQSAVA